MQNSSYTYFVVNYIWILDMGVTSFISAICSSWTCLLLGVLLQKLHQSPIHPIRKHQLPIPQNHQMLTRLH